MLSGSKVPRRRCAKACWSCKRRKERCDSNRPCGRCVQRGVGDGCASVGDSVDGDLSYDDSTNDSADRLSQSPRPNDELYTTPGTGAISTDVGATSSSYSIPFGSVVDGGTTQAHSAHLIPTKRDEFTFIGDAANLVFFQIIHRLVARNLESCELSDGLSYQNLVEAAPLSRKRWMLEAARDPPHPPNYDETVHFLEWYCRATNCILNVFNEADLHKILLEWQQDTSHRRNDNPLVAVFYLVLAIGAQASPKDFDETAEKYFCYGAFLSTTTAMIDAITISTVMANLLITMYLLSASQQDAAFLSFGSVVRAVHALGIHRREINELLGPDQCMARERLWKATRILDSFMSSSLGRPLSTTETRDTQAELDYSPSTDLCAIFEITLARVYCTRTASSNVMQEISARHRTWARRFSAGLAIDDIQPELLISTSEGRKIPNIGLCHLKEAYYWSIMLLTRPFLIESAARHLEQSVDGAVASDTQLLVDTSSPSFILAHACIDSAIRTVDLLRVLDSYDEIPKRLPFVVNSLFLSALVLGLAELGGLDHTLPVRRCLTDAQRLLSRFSSHDAVAQRDILIVKRLHNTCITQAENRTQRTMAKNSERFGGLFECLCLP
ncbi:unnamed protein product [Clonostachys byssicola]|uniref:Zn(2)-C6 fungal-type domain-containing protein n=1 Tax=Clonostachys byssicola TaxID=160290 RepID=A0A9N9Y4W3_9HYPO|nr:unnamed protein product [Clonostachys byssicola]